MPSGSRRPKRFSLCVQYATAVQGVPSRSQFRRWVGKALQRRAAVVIRVVDEREARALNQHFRGRNYATNVLTFPYPELKPLAGDIVLCAPVVEREAREAGKPLMAHYAHLTIHGVLHLQGHDHQEDQAAAKMEGLESRIMRALGYADPYAARAPTHDRQRVHGKIDGRHR
ncbi:MAG: rRNA maturation RNase YbeY [Azospira oryzae]|nr:MAG: rRNA maturation RNase YbeY [Azospira oryzae]PZP83102.1 MAG: rRNA maturation RNase YbeY [Azospira oryzae]